MTISAAGMTISAARTGFSISGMDTAGTKIKRFWQKTGISPLIYFDKRL
ncbi:MAG: hypothetical protein JNM88_13510 [Chitinophagaceae bacterium]|nr:hypothetical protein [Chitinophagaceae bacterium]